MPLGWIDFSKTERSKVLTERGTLDELGIAPIRDGFSNLFFPGTSTIQTRAKYFFFTNCEETDDMKKLFINLSPFYKDTANANEKVDR